MKKTHLSLLFVLLTICGFGQTYLRLKQIEPAAGANRTVITGAGGVQSYTTALPVSMISGISATSPLFYSAGTFTIQPASTLQDGALSSTDWNTFNNKQAALVSGTNIKTINGASILGSGNITAGDALTSGNLSQFASTTSSQLAGVISNETGSGLLVFNTSPTFSTSVNYDYATASRVATFDGSKNLVSSSVTTTELGYVSGVTSAIQTQIDARKSGTNFFTHTALNPADANVYYIGSSIALSAGTGSSVTRRGVAPFTGSKINVTVMTVVAGTLGSSETATLKIKNITAGTETTVLTTLKYDATGQGYAADITLAYTAGQSMEVEITMPTFVTNPTGVTHTIMLTYSN